MALTLRSKGAETYFWEREDDGESLGRAGPWLPPGQACAPGKGKTLSLQVSLRPGGEAGCTEGLC